MADRPILFSGPMVRALLDGRKTQTRRFLKKPAALDALAVLGPSFLLKRGNVDLVGYAPGDRLWVRESWRAGSGYDGAKISDIAPWSRIWFPADETDDPRAGRKTRPSIHMPRWASRLTLTVTEVRVQRLQEISEGDADAECFGGGFPHEVLPALFPDADKAGQLTLPECFARLWNSLHGPGAWDANPWVVAISFDVARRNIDAG